MPLLYIVKYGHPALRAKAEKISEDSSALQTLIDDMFETMYDAPGVGLAAPQVGVGRQLFVMDPAGNRDDEATHPRVVINPEILEESAEDDSLSEGCLSLPDVEGDVYRAIKIRVRYLDRNLEECEGELLDFEARVFQHEYDHLQGVFFTDHMPLARRTLLGPRLMRIKKEAAPELRAHEEAARNAGIEGPPFRLIDETSSE